SLAVTAGAQGAAASRSVLTRPSKQSALALFRPGDSGHHRQQGHYFSPNHACDPLWFQLRPRRYASGLEVSLAAPCSQSHNFRCARKSPGEPGQFTSWHTERARPTAAMSSAGKGNRWTGPVKKSSSMLIWLRRAPDMAEEKAPTEAGAPEEG